MKRPRHLSAEERALWDRVADRTTPLDPARPVAPELPAVLQPKVKKPVARPALPKFSVGERADPRRANDVLPSIAQRLTRAPVQMDAKAHGKLKRGKLLAECLQMMALNAVSISS